MHPQLRYCLLLCSTYSSIQPYLPAAPPRPPEQTVRNKWGRAAYLPGAELKGERRCLGQAFFHLCSGICVLLSRTPILPTSWSSRAVAFCLGKIAYCLLYDTFICVRKFVALHILEGSKENVHVSGENFFPRAVSASQTNYWAIWACIGISLPASLLPQLAA